jgi:hypothetical protein
MQDFSDAIDAKRCHGYVHRVVGTPHALHMTYPPIRVKVFLQDSSNVLYGILFQSPATELMPAHVSVKLDKEEGGRHPHQDKAESWILGDSRIRMIEIIPPPHND